MLTSITPLGELGKRQRWGVTATAYALGSVLGGSVLGLAAGLLGAPLPSPCRLTLLLAGLACLVAALSDARVPRWRLPGGRRQVDEDWLTRYRGWVYGVGFGFQLGLGVVTVVTSAATYALVVLAVLGADPLVGLALGAVFGAVRALPLLAVRDVRSPAQLRAVATRLERRAPGLASAVVGALVLAGVVLLAGAALA